MKNILKKKGFWLLIILVIIFAMLLAGGEEIEETEEEEEVFPWATMPENPVPMTGETISVYNWGDYIDSETIDIFEA